MVFAEIILYIGTNIFYLSDTKAVEVICFEEMETGGRSKVSGVRCQEEYHCIEWVYCRNLREVVLWYYVVDKWSEVSVLWNVVVDVYSDVVDTFSNVVGSL